ncbi:MAG: AAA family ATPase [Deltaproteobacteria bacterium]|nr:AAA family ATPase [Deltaproteobacteria bacterium]MBP7290938.1 AAA family ATPase [Nannocystaceae bacterium]
MARSGPPCSCEVVEQLATGSAVASLLTEFGLDGARLAEARSALHGSCGPESGDWRARLGDGGRDDPHERLLAIVRSADSHGYRLLEAVGVSCPALRRGLVERRRPAARGLAARSERAVRRIDRSDRADSARVPRLPLTPRNAERQPRATSPRPRAFAPAGPSEPSVRTPRRTPDDAPPARRGEPAVPPPTSAAVAATPIASPMPTAIAPAAVARSRQPRPQPLDPSALPKLCGRDDELARLRDAAARTTGRTVLLCGAPGSGRSLLARHLARAEARPVFALSALDYLDDDDDALAEALAEADDRGALVLFDDLDKRVLDSAPSWLPLLAQAWTRDAPRVLPVVSFEGLMRLTQWLPGVLESTDVIRIAPLVGPAIAEAVAAATPTVLGAHGVTLPPELTAAEFARLSDRYLGGIAQPGRALDLLDLACARAGRRGDAVVQRTAVLELVAERSGVPRSRIEAHSDQDALELEGRIAERVVGHREAVVAISELVRRARAGLAGSRPMLTALLLGPSGVGKTELAKALSQALFERDDALVRLDMSEYSEPHAVARIVGAPPGYVGFEQGGALTDPLLARPHAVVLLDEIEKAHRDVHQLLLQVLDEGRLTDGRGRTIDFRHAAILMTSNLGADHLRRDRHGVHLDADAVLDAARGAFPIELWNRIEAPLVMQPLGHDELRRICRKLARASSDRLLRERGVRYELSDDACERLIAKAGDDPRLGARPLRHLVAREVDPLVADRVLRGRVRAGAQLVVDVDRSGFVVR